jgi:hypothetical protein
MKVVVKKHRRKHSISVCSWEDRSPAVILANLEKSIQMTCSAQSCSVVQSLVQNVGPFHVHRLHHPLHSKRIARVTNGF